MGKTFSTGLLTNGVFQDASNNIGIGAAPSGTYKLEVTGTAKVSSTLLVSGALTLSSTISNGTYTYTLPSATGTLALTSSLSSYLPLSAGTGNKITGDLYINKVNSSLVFQGNTTDALIYNNGSNLSLVDNATGLKGLILNVSTGSATFTGTVQITGYQPTSSGAGLELFYYNSKASLIGYDRTNSVYKPMALGVDNQLYLPINGNVGIGTGNPVYNLDVYSTASNSIIRAGAFAIMQNVATSQAMFGYNITYDTTLGWRYINSGYTATAIRTYGGDIVFHLAASGSAGASAPNWDSTDVKMTIKNGGALLINTSTVIGSDARLNVYSDGAGPSFSNGSTGQQSLLLWNKGTTGDNLWVEFHVGSTLTAKGSIDYNRASNLTRYNTSSDANLKNIIGDSNLKKSVEILSTTKIREYSWKEDETNKPQIGVIAQELYETFKGAVSVGSDESLLGTEDYKSWKVDKTAFTFHLIAGWQKHEQIIQEQQAMITSLQDRLDKAGL